MDGAGIEGDNPPPQDEQDRLRAEGWRMRGEERRETRIAAKVIRANGTSHNVTISDISERGLRLDGADGLAIGERVLLLLPDHRVVEVAIRWALEDQAGGRILD